MPQDGSRFGTRIDWRDSMREARFAIFDARVVFFVLLFAFHISWWTFGLLFGAVAVFWIIERAGYRFPSALRTVRSTFAGQQRPARARCLYRSAVDYGFEYRRLPHRELLSRASAESEAAARAETPAFSLTEQA